MNDFNNREKDISRNIEEFERLRSQLEKAYSDMEATDAQLIEISDSLVYKLQTRNWYRNVEQLAEEYRENIEFFNRQSQSVLKNEIELLNNVIENLRDELDKMKNGYRV